MVITIILQSVTIWLRDLNCIPYISMILYNFIFGSLQPHRNVIIMKIEIVSSIMTSLTDVSFKDNVSEYADFIFLFAFLQLSYSVSNITHKKLCIYINIDVTWQVYPVINIVVEYSHAKMISSWRKIKRILDQLILYIKTGFFISDELSGIFIIPSLLEKFPDTRRIILCSGHLLT